VWLYTVPPLSLSDTRSLGYTVVRPTGAARERAADRASSGLGTSFQRFDHADAGSEYSQDRVHAMMRY